jgi:hypothetical protein
MNMIAKGLLACAFGIVSAVSAQAATQRYQFDVVGVTFGFADGGAPAVTSPDYDPAIDALHPLAGLRNQTFSTTVDIVDISDQFPVLQNNFAPDIVSEITCVSGPLCVANTPDFKMMPSGVGMGLASPNGTRFGSDPVFTADYMINLRYNPTDGTGTFSLATDIGDFFRTVNVNGTLYSGQGPSATFALANVSVAPAPVPLPASSALLGAGLIPLVALRRRKI